ncbi:MAG TPA: LCP family protein [Ktedonobacterales bacterium]|jgi:LCP family protein required for cell wall assembly
MSDRRPMDDWGGWSAPARAPRAGQAAREPVLPPLPRHAVRPAGWENRPTGTQPLWPGMAPARVAPPPGGGGPRRRHWLRNSMLALLVVLLILGALALRAVFALGNAISAQGPLTSQTGYFLGAGRVNVLVLGYGGGNHDGANLTDSLMILSLDPHSGATAMVSVPRDLWVQVPPAGGQYAKINTAYQVGLGAGYAGLAPGRDAGAALAARKVSDVTGLDLPYWVTLNFSGFRALVDALGGVDLTVPTAFTANYPANDDPSIDASWKTVHFATGRQHMDGERAIEYARARYVLDPPSEGTDFARSARQQLLVRAVFSQARQPGDWPRLTNASKVLGGALASNLSLADLALFGEKLDLNHARHIGLTTQNVLVGATSDDGQSILLPANDDWNAVRQYVARQMGS